MNWDWHIASKGLVFIALSMVVSCSKDRADCFEGRGEQTVERISLERFDALHIENRLDVRLVQDTADFMDITYGKNAIAGIQYELQDETLRVFEVNRCDWMRKQDPLPVVEIHYADLERIFSENAGSILFENAFSGDSLTVEVEDVSGTIFIDVVCEALDLLAHTGATDIEVSGTTNYAYIYNAGYAPLQATDLVARTVSVHNNSLGDTYVNAWETLYYQIYHQGDVYLSGSASAVRWNQSGGGRVVRLD